MKYLSTRGQAPVLGFADVLLAGLAADGGLYLPQDFPRLKPGAVADLAAAPWVEAGMAVMAPFVGDAIPAHVLRAVLEDSAASFDHAAVTPLVQLDDRTWLLELFHGPTLAFKDVALQILGRLFDHVLLARGGRVTIVGATSGDTGSAAIEACRGRDAIDIFILHPHGRVSEVQRRQMTSVDAPNVHNIAVDGSFDDCQDMVKALFADDRFRDEVALSAVNSINWARIISQSIYYLVAAARLAGPATFVVPTGNFGNVFAGHVARRIGVPVAGLVIGSNRNDILPRFFGSGGLEKGEVVETLSPAMDIQISSNLERYLYELLGEDGAATADLLGRFRRGEKAVLGEAARGRARAEFSAHAVDDAQTLAEIARTHAETGLLIDPHTAVGRAAARRFAATAPGPVVTLGCAHPAKFPEAVERATGRRPALPARLEGLMDKKEHCTRLEADAERLKDVIRQSLKDRT